MHSHYRQRMNEKSHRAHYCPLDLYSCDQARVQTALRGLHDDWVASSGSVNNLRFFLDGQLVLPSDVRYHAICVTLELTPL
jgi:inositol-pentakisphosphate 2-kinase